ncbi:hypothetical protein GUA46_14230 [Muricauda sp. HICW]|uniref:Lipoprotein n=1 Tax=Flagellimonas chongwuensis TaxID=2697365 RepID=A0A850NF65_9FLAO|nr:hypothetical protein [Allomuricauda chongwuensis]NVN19503.1 hypothetical protein [Allomuricauda chongwuensis]
MMKKYGLLLALSILMALATSCREKKLNHPKQGEELREVKESQTESMEKYKEWSESDKATDSTAIKTDSTNQDSID